MPSLEEGTYLFVGFSRDEHEGVLKGAVSKSYDVILKPLKEQLQKVQNSL